MIETMYRNKVSGIYVIFSTSNLDGNTESKTGFHVRDLDPTVSATTQYSDLLLECAPILIVKAMNIATDTGWDTRYDFGILPTAITLESRSWRPIERKSGCRRTITAAGAPARSPTCPPG